MPSRRRRSVGIHGVLRLARVRRGGRGLAQDERIKDSCARDDNFQGCGEVLVYNARVLLRSALIVLLSLAAGAQQNPPPAAPPGQPPVRVNVVNVCTPSPEEQKDIAAALGRIPANPHFAADFEVARGRTSTPGSSASNWVRVRREFPGDAVFATVQYSFVMDDQGMLETLVFRVREP